CLVRFGAWLRLFDCSLLLLYSFFAPKKTQRVCNVFVLRFFPPLNKWGYPAGFFSCLLFFVFALYCFSCCCISYRCIIVVLVK
ncbi:hypothetical protein, partial [Thiolapillus sp.]|uniref:hypothetical protein n=1 Tax=Thiolapillus sp. TaxID=2017437 RepID=UPI003AF848B8